MNVLLIIFILGFIAPVCWVAAAGVVAGGGIPATGLPGIGFAESASDALRKNAAAASRGVRPSSMCYFALPWLATACCAFATASGSPR